jgi:hypothetical protein
MRWNDLGIEKLINIRERVSGYGTKIN